ncbi:MAG: DegT/DnrJ/EryC1/StrS family aminotransferase [Armatimonadetes bacterium]|nr:DegT/DnrJ/EryC1/StrS family aminotransferase [Armatimonadota bacterium]
MAKLAINGGNKVIDKRIGIHLPVVDEDDVQAVADVVRSGVWGRGGIRLAADAAKEELAGRPLAAFEQAFAAFQGGKHVIGVSSGTAALYIGLKASGIGCGDEVIVPVSGFIGTATVCFNVNAIPILVDLDPETFNISPEAIEAAITDRTRAIIPVHLGGYPADMDRIMEIARRHNLIVIEDCAHAHGSQWRGQGMGTVGSMGEFSFQMSKTITSGDGGAIITNDTEFAELCLWNAGYSRPRDNVYHNPIMIFRMTQMQGALLGSQFGKFQAQREKKEANARILADGLREIGGITPIFGDPRVTRHGIWFLNFRYDKAHFGDVPLRRFLRAVQAEGAPISSFFVAPITRDVAFRELQFTHGCPVDCPKYGKTVDYTKGSFPVADRASDEEGMSIAQRSLLGSEDDMRLIVEAVRKVHDNISELRAAA